MNGNSSKIPTTLPLSACSADIPLREGDKGACLIDDIALSGEEKRHPK